MTDSESPDGRFGITISASAARMSHWIETPTLSDRLTNEVLLSFEDRHWSLDEAHWQNDFTVALTLRKYPGNHTPVDVVATVDCLERVADVGATRVSLDELEHHLDGALTWVYGAPPAEENQRSGLVGADRRGRAPE